MTRKNSIYIFNSDKMIFALREAFIDLGLKMAQMLIWVKQAAVIGRLDYMPQHELILYGWYGTHDFRRSKDKSVIFYPRPSKSVLHPSMKPPGLLRKLILNSTEINGVVYDAMGGSGSTLIACEQTKRKCVMVEIDPQYCEVIVKRWKKLTHHGTE
jgi:DNA modification methylase